MLDYKRYDKRGHMRHKQATLRLRGIRWGHREVNQGIWEVNYDVNWGPGRSLGSNGVHLGLRSLN